MGQRGFSFNLRRQVGHIQKNQSEKIIWKDSLVKEVSYLVRPEQEK